MVSPEIAECGRLSLVRIGVVRIPNLSATAHGMDGDGDEVGNRKELSEGTVGAVTHVVRFSHETVRSVALEVIHTSVWVNGLAKSVARKPFEIDPTGCASSIMSESNKTL